MDYSGEENSDGGAVISEWNRDDHNRHVVKTMEAEDKSSGAARALEITDLSDIHRNVMATMWFSSGSIATATIVATAKSRRPHADSLAAGCSPRENGSRQPPLRFR
uniref:Uncharacterized protein n=1 Tax=Oryza sativa subsp. japonica TaxID=39947 RepID=Q6YS46_ORYSJ|nr:hypothetical protein [Oryza sativa Japonica Group]